VDTYRVASITVVDKEDHTLLGPTDETQLTLVTCYPFYFVGHAPQRYIVRAESLTPPAEALPPDAVAAD
jgi:sortase A